MMNHTTIRLVMFAVAVCVCATSGEAKSAEQWAGDAGPSAQEQAQTHEPSADVSPPAAAISAPDGQSQEWRRELSLYGWFSGISSTVTARGEETTTEVEFKDILKAIDFASFGHFEVQRGNWGLFSELDFVKLSTASEVRLPDRFLRVDTAVTLRQTMVELGGIRSFDGERVGLDVLAGARYVRFDIDSRLGPRDSSTTKDWVDPLIGARLRLCLSDRWQASLRGDVGGFGVGSKLATNAVAVVSCKLSDRYSLGFGYRYLDIEKEGNRAKFDSTTYGPVVGVAIRF